jgi:phytoene dehydrogenase-like protein
LSNIVACVTFFIMPDQCDVIIVGAGIGGLTAGAMLVQAGLRILILEKNPHPGGTAYVYQRKGFTFPMGPLGFTTPSIVRDTLCALDGDDLKLSQMQYRIKAFDLEIPLSLTFSEMIEGLTKLFPRERKSVKHFFKDMEEILSAMKFPDADLNRSILERASEKSALEYLSSLVKDWRLRRILGSQAGSLFTGTTERNFYRSKPNRDMPIRLHDSSSRISTLSRYAESCDFWCESCSDFSGSLWLRCRYSG